MNNKPIEKDSINVSVLPEVQAFAVTSMPLPKDHWLYAPCCEDWDEVRNVRSDTPKPILTHELRPQVIAALKYAIRGATANGADIDLDPDAMVQNAVYALCGPYQ